jgi:hypothetical protein
MTINEKRHHPTNLMRCAARPVAIAPCSAPVTDAQHEAWLT